MATDDNAAWGYLPCPKGYGGARAGAREPSKIQKKGPTSKAAARLRLGPDLRTSSDGIRC
ncbi:unnamed protein product [Streptomyces laurentii]|uniref:Uncharacterized protein n=1 Tax=Streptomyces laurentii TaxID=39478 RepID=A0A160NUA3_STRLU|nr:unnamed protein product [Streptomyces laurentii]